MKCQNCGRNEATYYYKSSINGRVTETHLCADCARKLGYVQRMQPDSFFGDDFFSHPFRLFEPLLGGFGNRLLTEFPEPVDVTRQAQQAVAEAPEDALVDKAEQERKLSAGGAKLEESGYTADTGKESLSSTAAESLQRAVGNYLKSGREDAAQALWQRYAGRMTPVQRQRFETLFAGYGRSAGL